MPSSFALPPVGYCRGTMPSQAGKLASLMKRGSVADGSYDGGGNNRPDARDLADTGAAGVCVGDLLQLRREFLDLLFDELPLVPQHADQVAHLGCQVSIGVLQRTSAMAALSLAGVVANHQAAFEQESAQLVDHCRAP